MLIFFGAFLMFVGFLFSITIIGAVIGIPLMIVGGAFIVFGFLGRRKTVINNVITVQNATAPAASTSGQAAPGISDTTNLPPAS